MADKPTASKEQCAAADAPAPATTPESTPVHWELDLATSLPSESAKTLVEVTIAAEATLTANTTATVFLKFIMYFLWEKLHLPSSVHTQNLALGYDRIVWARRSAQCSLTGSDCPCEPRRFDSGVLDTATSELKCAFECGFAVSFANPSKRINSGSWQESRFNVTSLTSVVAPLVRLYK